jgi:hypothetical protein
MQVDLVTQGLIAAEWIQGVLTLFSKSLQTTADAFMN